MSNPKVTGLRGVELAVPDLAQSAAFYCALWGLEESARDGEAIHLRANGDEHHVLTLRERPSASLLGVHFAATERNAVIALHAKARALGANVIAEPADLPRSGGGGCGFSFRS